MSSWFEREGLKGFASWMRVQAQEEDFHAKHMHDYLLRRGEPSRMKQIEAPQNDWANVCEVFEQVEKHEKFVTKSINEIASAAIADGDHAAYQFILWYVDEQVEEEETVADILGTLKLINNNPQGLYIFDKELGARTYTQPDAT
jgi:ferritin